MKKIGVIGCGNMGGGMVAHLLSKSFPVFCYEPSAPAREKMVSLGASVCRTARSLVESVDVLILSLPNAQIVEQVVTDIVTFIPAGTIVLDTSTSIPATTQAMYQLGKVHGFHFIDGPVSGGPAAAVSGNMTMLLAGDKQAIDNIHSVIEALTAKTVYVGASGAGHAAKIANNMLCAANLVLVSEAIKLGECCGVNAEDLLEGVNAGSGRSGVSEVNFPRWVLNDAFNSGFTMGLMRKDVRLALELSEQSGITLSGFAKLAEIWLNSADSLEDSADFNEITRYTNTLMTQ